MVWLSMRPSRGAFWPLSPLAAFVASAALVLLLLVAWAVAEAFANLAPRPEWILLTVVVIALVPVLLYVLDGVARGGGSLELKGVRITLAATAYASASPTMPRNAGLQPGQLLNDSGNEEILQMLAASTVSRIVVVDLEDGTAWWETRLLILVAGAAKRRMPQAIVFTAVMESVPNRYVGWAAPWALLDLLLAARPELHRAYATAAALASTWRLAEPPRAGAAPKWPLSPSRARWGRLAFPAEAKGLPSRFLEERILAAELSPHEQQAVAEVSVARLLEFLTPALHRQAIELSSADASWMDSFVADESEFVAVTEGGRYVGLISRASATNAVLREVRQG